MKNPVEYLQLWPEVGLPGRRAGGDEPVRVAVAAMLSGTFSPGWTAVSFVWLLIDGVAGGSRADPALQAVHHSKVARGTAISLLPQFGR